MPGDVVTLLIQNERAVAKLYKTCAKQFPDLHAFWDKLAEEELSHAELLVGMLENVGENVLEVDESRFKIPPLQISLEYTEEVTWKLEQGKINLVSALSIAHSIENSLFESSYFEIIKGESAFLNKNLKQLREETANHRDLLKDKLNKIRQREL